MYYEDEILKELEIGTRYTIKQLQIFLTENKDVIILDAHNKNYSVGADQTVVLKHKQSYFVHQFNYRDRSYTIPSNQTRIYIVE